MRFRVSALAGFLAIVMLALAADAQTLYVRNRPFPDRVNIGGTIYVPIEGFLRALKVDWLTQEDGSLVVTPGRGQGAPVTTKSFQMRSGARSLAVDGLDRNQEIWVPLRPVADLLGFKVSYTPGTETLDVVAGRPITASDRQAAADIASANAAREQAIQEAWNKRREAIQAERKAREEAEAAKAAAEAGEVEADPKEGNEGTFPSEMDARPAPRPSQAPPAPVPAAPPPAPAAPAEPAAPAKPEAPKPPPEAMLIVISPMAVVDYFTGTVRCTARIQNNGEAPASGISAQVTLRGPDGSVWNRQRVYRDGTLEVDGVWNLEASYVHPDGNAMPRGIPSVTVELDYRKN
ncbi:MAG: hypothetical protein ACOX9B_14055 [Candidatus Xenobium sp.]|jgi:hypothetical protein